MITIKLWPLHVEVTYVQLGLLQRMDGLQLGRTALVQWSNMTGKLFEGAGHLGSHFD